MREFGKVSPKIWQKLNFKALPTDEARLLCLYLHSCPHQNSSGCFKLPTGYALEDLSWDKTKFEDNLKLLREHGFVICDDATSEIYVKDWYQMNAPSNRKHALGLSKQIRKIESAELLALTQHELSANCSFEVTLQDSIADNTQVQTSENDKSYLLDNDRMRKYRTPSGCSAQPNH